MSKIRIQNFDENGNIEKTRILKLSTAIQKFDYFSKYGFNINLDLINKEDMANFSQFLFDFAENLDTPEPKKKKIKRTKESDNNTDWNDYRYEFLNNAFEKAKNDQDKLIEILRKEDFFMMDSITLLDRFPEFKKKISKIKRYKYQWMLKVLKFGVSPEKDSFDPYILIGMQISPRRMRKTLVYLNKEFLYSLRMDIPKRLDGVKKKPVQLVKYPDWMNYDERQKWGREHRKLMNDPSLQPSKFYETYNQDVTVKGNLIITEINNKK